MYHHFAGSFHLYEADVARSQIYLEEGYHTPTTMPPMPKGDPFTIVPNMLSAMNEIIHGEKHPTNIDDIPEYWMDILRLLLAYHNSLDIQFIEFIQSQMHDKSYFPYVERRKYVTRPRIDQI